jgi:hypothetical protein
VRRLTRHRDRWFGAATSVSTIGWSCVTLEGQNQPREYSCQSATPHRYGSPLEFCEWLARLAPREASRPPGSPARTPHQDPRATPADGLPLAIAPHPAAEPSASRSSAIPVTGTERGCRRAEYCRPPACTGESATQGGSRLPIISLILPGAHAPIDRAERRPLQRNPRRWTERGCRRAEYCRPPACNGESATQGGSRLPIISLILPGAHAPIDRTSRIPE